MKYTALFFVCGLLAGCVTQDDARLQGTWFLNRAATAAVSSNTPTHGVWVTYKHGVEVVEQDKEQYGYWDVTFHYHVVERGSNYVVIRTTAPQDKRQRIHIGFVDSDRAYWIDNGPLGFGIQERFDKLEPKLLPPGMGGIIPPQPIPLDQ